MPIRLIVVFIFLMMYTNTVLLGQNYSNWYFGQNAAVGVSQPNPAVYTNNAMNTPEGCASYSDALGNIRFYTNGVKMWNSAHQVIPQAMDLNGNIYATQSALFVGGIPNNSNLYLFTLDADAGPNGFQYNIINSGSGFAIQKNIPIKKNVTERMTAILHCDKKSYWVIVHGWNSDEFYAYHLGKDGLDTIPVVSKVGSVHTGNINNAGGYMKASEDGSLIALAKTGSNQVELFQFDNLNGTLSNPIVIPNITNAYGVEFSQYNIHLYVSSISGALHQYAVSNYNQAAIIASKQIVYSGTDLLGALQAAENNKIYLVIDNSPFLSCINYPVSGGASCGFIQNAVNLNGGHCEAGLPAVLPKTTKIEISVNTPCFGDTSFFNVQNIDSTQIDSIIWHFDDSTFPDSISYNFSPYYIYPNAGSYHPIIYVFYCNTVDTIYKDAIVLGPPSVYLGPDTFFCANNPITYSFSNGQSYLWQNGSTNSSFTANDTGWVWVQITNVCDTRTDSVYISKIFNPPFVLLPSDTNLCLGDSLIIVAGIDSSLIYVWQNNDTISQFIAYQTGNYMVKAIDSNNCTASDQIFVEFQEPPKPNLGNDTSLCIGESITFNGGPGDTYLWNNTITNPSILVAESGTYSVHVFNKCGEGVDSIRISFNDCQQKIWIPNAFTPDGDGLNDIFKPVLLNVKDFKMYIFDRWGQIIYYSDDLDKGWDGYYLGYKCLLGVYTYLIQYHDLDGNFHDKVGMVVLYR